MKSTYALAVTFVIGCQLQAQVVFKLSSSPGTGSNPDSVAVADVNGDGKMDLICANYSDNSLWVLTNNGVGGFVFATNLPVGGYPDPVITTDVNKDGKPDLISVNGLSSNLSVLTNNGSGVFVLAANLPVPNPPTSVVAVDVNGDTNVDLVSANWGGGGTGGVGTTLSVWTNNGAGGFAAAPSVTVDNEPYWVTAADVNGDGKMDLICVSWGHNLLSVLTNDGSGGFVLSGSNSVGSQPKCVVAADVNGDGKVDLITANSGSSTLTVLTNDGTGRFLLATNLPVGSGPLSVAAADVNGDGKMDLISANNGANTLSILTNNGFGVFLLATNLLVGSGPNSVTAADINGDGKVDLISPNGGNNNLWVLTNATVFPMSCGPNAMAVSFETNGFTVSITVTCGGSGYTNTPLVYIIDGGGSGAQAVATVSNGVVTKITVQNPGFGYTNNPLVIIDPSSVPRPVLGIRPVSFLSFTNLSPGSSYQLQEMFLAGWSNLFGSFTATNTLYTQAVPGTASAGNYRLALTPVPAQAFATAQVLSGFVIGATVTSPGSGYVSVPAVTIVGGGGSGATAVAQISAGAVTNIQVKTTGSGYTSTPTIQIAPPPATALTPTVVPGMWLNSSNLVPYFSYQYQFTPVLPTGWVSWDGTTFNPPVATNSQFLVISNSTGFFRLEYLGTP